MIRIFVTIGVTPQNRPQVLSLLEQITAASQAEQGCHHYQYYLHPKDPTQVVIFEHWESAAALDAHEQSEHFKTLLPQIGALATEVNINKF